MYANKLPPLYLPPRTIKGTTNNDGFRAKGYKQGKHVETVVVRQHQTGKCSSDWRTVIVIEL